MLSGWIMRFIAHICVASALVALENRGTPLFCTFTGRAYTNSCLLVTIGEHGSFRAEKKVSLTRLV